MGSLGVFVPIQILVQIVKTVLSLPASFIFLFGLNCNQILVHKGERLGQVLFGVGVEVTWVICNGLSQFFLLNFPNVHLLVSIGVYLDPFRHVNSWFKRSTLVETVHKFFVGSQKVGGSHETSVS